MTKQCTFCDKNYEVTIGQFKRRKFCSKECKIEYYLVKNNKSGNFTQRYKYRQGKIIRATMNLSKKQWQMCAGSLLGDSSIDISRAGSSSFRMQHCKKQLDYLEWKKSIISNFIVREKPTICKPTGFSKQDSYIYATVTHQNFSSLNDFFYIKKRDKKRKKIIRKKIINLKVLEKLNIFGILFWYLDDGCVAPTSGRNMIRLHTNNFSKYEQQLLVNFFKNKYQITPKIYYLKQQNNYILSINADGAEKLMTLFKPFLSQIPQCMHYKFF